MTKTRAGGWRAAHSITFPAQGDVKAGPRVTILSRNLAAGSALAALAGSIIKLMVES
jgi:hypothetical protein